MQESRKILLLGAGGHCRSVLDSLTALSCYDRIGLVNKINSEISSVKEKVSFGDILFACPVVGADEDLKRLFQEGYTDAFITVGSIGETSVRRRLYKTLKQIGFHIPNIIDKTSVISSHALLGEGIFVGKNAVVNTNANIGNCAIINTSAVIEHECSIGDFVHVAPGAILGGNVTVGTGTHIGSGSVIRQGIRIGSGSMVGMGSIVVNNIADNVTAYGNPCKEVKNE